MGQETAILMPRNTKFTVRLLLKRPHVFHCILKSGVSKTCKQTAKLYPKTQKDMKISSRFWNSAKLLVNLSIPIGNYCVLAMDLSKVGDLS